MVTPLTRLNRLIAGCPALNGVVVAPDAGVSTQAAPATRGHVWHDTEGVAKRLDISPRTLERMRGDGSGPRYAKAGRAVRYREDWIDEWLEARAFGSTSAARRAGIV